MKIVKIGSNLINLDRVIHLSLETHALTLTDGEVIRMTPEEVDQFVKDYNMFDTDDRAVLSERIARVVLSNPQYLTKEGIQEQVTIYVKYHDLKEQFKEMSNGKKLREIGIGRLIDIYRELQEIQKEREKNLPY